MFLEIEECSRHSSISVEETILSMRIPRLPFGDQRAKSVRTEEEFLALSRQARRPIADLSFRRSDFRESKVAGVRIGNLALGAVSSAPLNLKTFEDKQLSFLLPVEGRGAIVDGTKMTPWNAEDRILRSSYIKPLVYTTEAFSAISIRPSLDDLASAIAALSPKTHISIEELLESGTLGSPGEFGGTNYYDLLLNVLSVVQTANGDAELLNRIGIDSILNKLLAELIVAQQGTTVREVEPPTSSRSLRAVDLICDHIRETIGRPLTIPQMEKLVGLTGRALTYAFQLRFDCSPQQWQRNFLLGEARCRLFSEDRCVSVKTIAFELGFSSASSFSAHYKRRFGEHPSDTIARHHTIIHA